MKSLTILVLCHNEEKNLIRNAGKLRRLLKAFEGKARTTMMLEEDGSSDGTRKVIERLSREEPAFVPRFNDRRLGKGGGLRFGVEGIESDYVLVTDADMPVEIADYVHLFNDVRRGNDAVVINRRAKGTVSDIPWSRRVPSRLFNWYVRALFFLSIRDTQCGVKAFKTDSLRKILPRYATHLSMDVEMLYRAKRAKMKVAQIPAHYTHGKDSEISVPRDGLSMFTDILRLRWKFWRNGL